MVLFVCHPVLSSTYFTRLALLGMQGNALKYSSISTICLDGYHRWRIGIRAPAVDGRTCSRGVHGQPYRASLFSMLQAYREFVPALNGLAIGLPLPVAVDEYRQ